jgi:MFS family permease
MTTEQRAWYRELTPYHWFVFVVASAAWFFDCLDQRLFSLARNDAIKALAAGADDQALGKQVTALFLIGWGIGGMIFGALGDRYGRAKMLTVTVLIYSVCTGFSYFSQAYWDFALARFLTGVGVGGVFGLAVALIAETLPNNARSGALGWLQILSTVGNLSAGLVLTALSGLATWGVIAADDTWRWMFLVGAAPALLVVFTMTYLREPQPWLDAKAAGRFEKGNVWTPYAELFAEKQWRTNLIIGALLSSAGVIGLWAIVEYAVDIQGKVFQIYFEGQGLAADAIKPAINNAKSFAYTLQMIGAAVGMWCMTKACIVLGRKPAFAIWYVGALVSTVFVFWSLKTPMDAYWMMPLMWFFSLGVFAGYAIYLPELFPSRVRSTGTSFCYNLGRFAAAGGSYFSALLATDVFGGRYGFESPTRERYAAIAMCAVFVIALVTLPFAPETKGKPLPD